LQLWTQHDATPGSTCNSSLQLQLNKPSPCAAFSVHESSVCHAWGPGHSRPAPGPLMVGVSNMSVAAEVCTVAVRIVRPFAPLVGLRCGYTHPTQASVLWHPVSRLHTLLCRVTVVATVGSGCVWRGAL
jgi:hypothetical protein